MRLIANCPFCGGYSNLVRKSKTVVHGETKQTTYVECKVCHCRGQRFLLDDFKTSTEARDAAVESWNRRFDSTVYLGVDDT